MKKLPALPVFVIILFTSCTNATKINPQVSKYGEGWDSVRTRIGLPTVKNNLVLHNFAFECLDPYTDCAMFTNPDTSLKPRFARKNIYWDSAGISLERNYFVGPRNEVLQVYFGYKKFSDWTHIGFGYGFIVPGAGATKSFSKQQADSVLLSWNLQL